MSEASMDVDGDRSWNWRPSDPLLLIGEKQILPAMRARPVWRIDGRWLGNGLPSR